MTKGVKNRHYTMESYRNYTKVYMSTGKKTPMGNVGDSKRNNFNVLTKAFIATGGVGGRVLLLWEG